MNVRTDLAFDATTPFETVTSWNNTEGFRPEGAPRPAGDVNGDGKEDWLYKVHAAPAPRSADVSDRTTKSVLVYGGEFHPFDSQIYSQDLTPVGNFVGESHPDAITVTRSGVQLFRAPGEIYGDPFASSGDRSERGYQKAGIITASLGSPDAVASTDLDGDGFSDVVLVSASSDDVTVLYGAESRSGVVVQSYSPSSGASQLAHNVGDVDGDGHGEIVRVSGSGGTLTLDIFAIGDARSLSTQQSFSTTAFDLGAQYLDIDLQNINGADLTEIIARAGTNTQVFTGDGTGSYNTTPIAYTSYLRPLGDLDGDGQADFLIRDGSGVPYVAFGPSTVSDGLTADLKVARVQPPTTYDYKRYFRYGGDPLAHQGVTVGDLQGDAHQDVMIGELAGDDHHEIFRQDIDYSHNPQHVILGDLSQSGDFSSTGGLPSGLSLAGLNDSDRMNLLLDDQNHLLDHLFRARQQDVKLKDLNADRPTGDLDGDGKGEAMVRMRSVHPNDTHSQTGFSRIGVFSRDSLESAFDSESFPEIPPGRAIADYAAGDGSHKMGRIRSPQTVSVGDWDGDDTTDVAVLRDEGEPAKSVWIITEDPAQRDPTAAPHAQLISDDTTGALLGTGSMAAGDFDNDGSPNLAVAWPQKADVSTPKEHVVGLYAPGSNSTNMRISLSDLGISSTAPGIKNPDILGAKKYPYATVANVGDVNDDGTEDLAVAVPNAFSTASTAVFLYLDLADASPDVTIDYTDDGASYGVGQSIEGLGDVNGDGIDDFAVGDAYYDGGPSGTLGAMYVHYGKSTSTPSFGAPDLTITPDASSGANLQYFPWGIASGDFNGDDTTDVAAKPLVFESSSMQGGEGIHVYHGGVGFDGTPEETLAIPARPLDAVGYMKGQNAYFNYGELTTVPAAGSGADRLLVGTHVASNALIYAHDGSGLKPSRVLRAKDNRTGLGAGSPFMNLPNNESSAVGDFDGDGRVDLLLPQAYFPSYQATPVYAYELDAGASGNSVPIARADSYKTTAAELYKATQQDSLEVTAGSGVLANDSDPDSSDALSAALVTDVSNGSLQLSSDGGFKYVPNEGFDGTDFFVYEARDGRGGTARDTATLRVIPQTAPDAVTAVQPTSGTAGERVRIYGNGFTPTASGNTVTIGGTQATVDSATTTAIYARVPSGVSGPSSVAVTSAGVTKHLTGPFTAVTKGQPSFAERETSLPPVSNASTARGDFDNDGDLDLAIAGEDTSGAVDDALTQIYRNDGSGSFTAVGAGIVDVYRGDLEWADYDRDGDLDLLVTGAEVNSSGQESYVTRIYRNDGGGTFTDIEQIPPYRDAEVDWGDFDGDGDPDLAIAGVPKKAQIGEPLTTIYENEGDDEFSPLGVGLTGVEGGAVAWGDYDGDHDQDLLVFGTGTTTQETTILYRNDGQETFTRAFARLQNLGSRYQRGGAAWGDYDNDGDLDLVTTGESKGGPSTTLYQNEGGTFTPVDVGLVDIEGRSAVWVDYDNDGDLDLLITGTRRTGQDLRFKKRTQVTTLYENRGENTFVGVGAGLPDVRNGEPAWGDFDGDGDLDLVFTGDRYTGGGSGTKTAALYENTTPTLRTADLQPGSGSSGTSLVLYGTGFDTTATSNTVTFGGTQATVTQATHRTLHTQVPSGVTGPVSLSVDNGSSTTTLARRFLGTTGLTGVFATAENTGLSVLADRNGISLDWGDYDGDGDQDLAMAGYDGTANTARIYENIDGAFLTIDAGIDLVTAVKWGDYDNDGDLDLLARGEHSTHTGIKLFRNDGSDTFTATDLLNVTLSEATMNWGDYDRDGDLDVVVTGTSGYGDYHSRIYRNDGDSFVNIGAGLLGAARGDAVWGDYDNDGDLDVFITGTEGSTELDTPIIYRNDGGDNFVPVEVPDGAQMWGDYDQDGDLDLIGGKKVDYEYFYYVYENKGDGQFEKRPVDLPDKSLTFKDWRDIDDDGDLDLFLDSYTDDGYVLYRNIGDGEYRRIDAGLTPVQSAAFDWGDYNGDGALDLILMGTNASTFEDELALHRGVPTGTSVPGAPSGLSAAAPEDSVALSWTASSAADVEEYRIYRDTTAITAPREVALDTVSADTTAFADTTAAPDVVYRYRVTAVDTLGHESALTSEVQAMLEGVTVAGLSLQSGWDLTSVPVSAPDSGFAEVFPQCAGGFAFQASGGYQPIASSDPVSPGEGLFAECAGGTSALTGRIPDTATVDVDAGWNLIGPHVDSVDASKVTSDPSGIVTSQYYGLDQGYVAADTLVPGEGYWVRTSQNGTLDLASGISKKGGATGGALAEKTESAGAALSVTDARGRSATLRLASSLSEQQKKRSALPPVPPGKTFDVRFAGDRSASAFEQKGSGQGSSSLEGSEVTFRTIELRGMAYPVTVRLEDATGQTVLLRRGGAVGTESRLTTSSSEATLREGEGRLQVALRPAPKQFALKKHYPNPASRRATIEYAVPEQSEVTIQLYDVLGRRVATVVDGAKQAGRYTTRLDASRLASGTYFYRMRASDYTKTRRLVIVR